MLSKERIAAKRSSPCFTIPSVAPESGPLYPRYMILSRLPSRRFLCSSGVSCLKGLLKPTAEDMASANLSAGDCVFPPTPV